MPLCHHKSSVPTHSMANITLCNGKLAILICRPQSDREGRTYGWSMTAVGSVATLYHAATGKMRTVLRKADYYTISLACMAMADSMRSQQRGYRRTSAKLISLAALPFKPTAVTACYATQMEVRLSTTLSTARIQDKAKVNYAHFATKVTLTHFVPAQRGGVGGCVNYFPWEHNLRYLKLHSRRRR